MVGLLKVARVDFLSVSALLLFLLSLAACHHFTLLGGWSLPAAERDPSPPPKVRRAMTLPAAAGHNNTPGQPLMAFTAQPQPTVKIDTESEDFLSSLFDDEVCDRASPLLAVASSIGSSSSHPIVTEHAGEAKPEAHANLFGLLGQGPIGASSGSLEAHGASPAEPAHTARNVSPTLLSPPDASSLLRPSLHPPCEEGSWESLLLRLTLSIREPVWRRGMKRIILADSLFSGLLAERKGYQGPSGANRQLLAFVPNCFARYSLNTFFPQI